MELLRIAARPIVLMQSLGVLPENIAPDMARIGVMLAYAPVHHLLFHAGGRRQAQISRWSPPAPIRAASRWSSAMTRRWRGSPASPT